MLSNFRVQAAALGLLSIVTIASAATALATPALVTQTIDDQKTVELAGNTRPEALAANDRGPVDDSLALDHLQLLLKRPAASEEALVHRIEQLTDRTSPYYHQWLTTEELGEKYGPAEADVHAVTDWLKGHGFTVNVVPADGMLIDFSGTAGAVREAFHTEIHNLRVNGVAHIANMSNPRIPAALAGVVHGVVSLHDFRPHTNMKPKPAYSFDSGGYEYYTVVPGDLAKIYNLSPLFSAGITGKGQSIVVIEDTDVYSTTDWSTFRSTFGLSSYKSGSFSQEHPEPPGGKANCTDPGVVSGNEVEAELDAEWSSAAAPDAAIVLASCKDTRTTFGGLIALENLLDSRGPPPAIVSISYGECEPANGATANAAYNTTYEKAVSRGTSVFVSSGDEGAASCDADQSIAKHGISVSGFASTPYNVAVGGTDFGDSYAGTNATYWKKTNSKTYESALSYVPEIPWNDSCASELIAAVEGYSQSFGTTGFCNSTLGEEYFLSTASGSGGPSGCATGSPSTKDVVSGTCAGYAKPSWQALLGNPSDGVRDIPDVSLFAANGVWGHYYIFCDSDAADGGPPCTGAPSGWAGAGGTSFASPIMAGIQALINEKTGSRQGNPNPTYYALAAAEYGSHGSTSCNSTAGNGVSSSCVFYDVTLGDMDVNCTGKYDCYLPSGANGVLSTSDTSFSLAYGSAVGWDFATGIGSVNATNLVNSW
jgi:subtilase family serine protease